MPNSDDFLVVAKHWSQKTKILVVQISLHNSFKLMCQNHKDLIWTFIYFLGNVKTCINFTRNFIKMCYNERNFTTLINNSINLIRC